MAKYKSCSVGGGGGGAPTHFPSPQKKFWQNYLQWGMLGVGETGLVVTRASCYSCVFSKTNSACEIWRSYTAIRKSYGQKKSDFYLSE